MSAMAGRSVFVTGAYGLLGGQLVKGLVARGADVTVLKRDDTVVAALVLEGTEAHCNVVNGELADLDLMGRVLAEYEIGDVFHLAAQTLVGTANASPLSTWETNIRGTYMLLEACRTYGVERVVVAASDKAYGPHDTLPYVEDAALQPRYPYDVSKAATDLIARSYWHTYGLPVAVTRFANLYGGGDVNRSRLIPEAIVAALRDRAPVIRSDGSPERDFLFVEDAVEAYLSIADRLGEGGTANGEAFNAGSGKPHSVREVVELVCKVAGTKVEPDIRGAGTPSGEIDRQYVDATKIREVCGWTPKYDLESGLARTVDWYREHLDVMGA
jgi:CDP-glucose 4,6-dehydratase